MRFIEGIEFYGYHGASDEEQSVGHRYEVDLEVRLDTRAAGRSDDLSDTVNYSALSKRVVAIGAREQFRLVEALAERITAALLREFPIDSVRLRVRKGQPIHVTVGFGPLKNPAAVASSRADWAEFFALCHLVAWHNKVRRRLWLTKPPGQKDDDDAPDNNRRVLRGMENNSGPSGGNC